MDSVPDILEALGGVTAVANETGIPLTTVHSWKRTGSVPRWRVPTLVSLAARLGVEITEDSFPSRSRNGGGHPGQLEIDKADHVGSDTSARVAVS